MGGRDLRMFITNHRAEDIEKLTIRLKDGLGSTKYKPLQYEQLQPILDARRVACAHTVQKIQKTQQVAQRARQKTLLRQHREVWMWEQAKLMKAGEKAEAELQSFLEKNRDGVISQMQDYELILEREREGFREATVKPIWQLKEDLQYRLAEVQQRTLQQRSHSEISDWDSVLREVKSVKDQQGALVENLHFECLSVEQEIFAIGIEESLSSAEEILGALKQNPEELLSAWCSYPDFKTSLLQEFHALSEKYESKLLNITNCLQEIGRCCGWPEEDHMVFQMVMSQYTHDLNNHRTLSMDMLQRLLPHRSRQELKDHEQSWDQYRFALAQQRALLQSWQQDRASLLIKSLAILEEARVAHQEELSQQCQRKHQQEICIQLKEKLQQWRAQQEELASLEAAMASRRREEEEDRLRREQERDRARRAEQKERVKEFYSEKQRRREEQEKKDQQRLEELRALMVEQARRDKERVQFREGLLLQRQRERETQALLRLEEEVEKWGHLEALRNQVAVVAEANPERMMGNTKAWQRRHQTGEEFVLHKPLYQLNSFTDRQILSDPRVRIEQALREAGFHNSPYAREVLSAVRPPRLPRRDTESTMFKS
ncbi:hypothetical protein COCON_G00049020 [Conger conger]|uniref:Coiled-coil domain containing 148 n=1 Tax=Conger conger TaxID=82655 RepID=A0A9Q1DV98_CONCO|nr:coiled-coil domain-containing protein 148-like [Conger conger]KAJ8282383.1 hypothetical protein COCON_G00049020 [Conger conger]